MVSTTNAMNATPLLIVSSILITVMAKECRPGVSAVHDCRSLPARSMDKFHRGLFITLPHEYPNGTVSGKVQANPKFKTIADMRMSMLALSSMSFVFALWFLSSVKLVFERLRKSKTWDANRVASLVNEPSNDHSQNLQSSRNPPMKANPRHGSMQFFPQRRRVVLIGSEKRQSEQFDECPWLQLQVRQPNGERQ